MVAAPPRARQTWIVYPGEHRAEPVHDFVVDFRPYRSDAIKPATALWTSTSVSDLPSAWLFHGWDGLVDLPLAVWHLRVDVGARVYEIAGPADWVSLCERYPADTTNVYADKWQHDWGFRHTASPPRSTSATRGQQNRCRWRTGG